MEDRLQKFANLVDAGSFTKAAEALHISQPALSAAVSKLERELHTTLLLRGTRPLKLTSGGEAAYAHAKETAVRTANLRAHIAQAAKQKLAVRVGMIDSLAEALFEHGGSLDRLEEQASVSFVVDNSRYLASAVQRDDIDIAFIVRPYDPNNHRNMRVNSVGIEPLLLVAASKLARATEQAVARGHLPNFISYDQSSTTFQLVRQTLSKRQVSFKPTFYSTSPEVILRLVLARKGVAALPYLMVRDLLKQKLLVAVSIEGSPVIERPVQSIQHIDKVLPEPLSYMAEQLREILKSLMTDAIECR